MLMPDDGPETNKQINLKRLIPDRMYERVWLAFVNIGAMENHIFNDLIDKEDNAEDAQYSGAWANILVVADDIATVLHILPGGLNELNFKVIFIDKIENLATPVENEEVNPELIDEVNWLLKSEFVFKISDRIFPYE